MKAIRESRTNVAESFRHHDEEGRPRRVFKGRRLVDPFVGQSRLIDGYDKAPTEVGGGPFALSAELAGDLERLRTEEQIRIDREKAEELARLREIQQFD